MSRKGAREGTRAIGAHIAPDLHKQVRQLSLDTDKTIQVLVEEAIALLLREYKRSEG